LLGIVRQRNHAGFLLGLQLLLGVSVIRDDVGQVVFSVVETGQVDLRACGLRVFVLVVDVLYLLGDVLRIYPLIVGVRRADLRRVLIDLFDFEGALSFIRKVGQVPGVRPSGSLHGVVFDLHAVAYILTLTLFNLDIGFF